MKYISADSLLESIRLLKDFNVFFGTSYLSCKEVRLPVGSQIDISLDNLNKDFLVRHYRIHPRSRWFFRVLRFNEKNQDWLRPDYAGKGLQSVNTRTFKSAFLHEKKSSKWGWSPNYIDILQQALLNSKKIPMLPLACWIFKKEAWSDQTTSSDIIAKFTDYFAVNAEEQNKLFDLQPLANRLKFDSLPLEPNAILNHFSAPPDLEPESGGILSYLEAHGTGCIKNLQMSLGERLNLITGDNGLGKTFILDMAWWALTGEWAAEQAYPTSAVSPQNATIKFQISSDNPGDAIELKFAPKLGRWQTPRKRPTLSGLVIYARVDGSFSVWDPHRTAIGQKALNFTRDDVFKGNEASIEGLLRDWISWQATDSDEFRLLMLALKELSPPDLGIIEAGPPIRLIGDYRDTPSIVHRYGQVPLKLASAGIRRILTLAYLVVWTWSRHLQLSRETGNKFEQRIVLIIDEIEAHLHPKWQRILLPAIIRVFNSLNDDIDIQILVASHSPLVLASVDSFFDSESDKTFHLDCTSSGTVNFEEKDFIRHGKVDNWLSSDIFGLAEPRSKYAETLIKRARTVQLEPKLASSIEVKKLTDQLLKVLPPDDEFWMTWLLFAEDHGVQI